MPFPLVSTDVPSMAGINDAIDDRALAAIDTVVGGLIQAGLHAFGSVAAGTAQVVVVNFATPFASPPAVSACVDLATSGFRGGAWVSGVTTTGFSLRAVRTDTASAYSVHWQAMARTQ